LFLSKNPVFSIRSAHNIRAIVENYSTRVFSDSIHAGIADTASPPRCLWREPPV
jgi:hypothetical protein